MLDNYFEIAIDGIKNRKLRSYLTVLGIVIGISFIVMMFSFSQGLTSAILEQMKVFGTDLAIVIPGSESTSFMGLIGGLRLSDDDVDALADVPGVEVSSPAILKTLYIEYRGERRPVLIHGHVTDDISAFEVSQGWGIETGRWYGKGKNEVTLGPSLANKGFDDPVNVGDKISINGETFKVTGITTKIGEGSTDSSAIMSLKVLRDLTGDHVGVDSIVVKVYESEDLDQVAQDLKEKLRRNRGVKRGQEDFTIITSAQASNVVANVLKILQTLLLGLTAIALGVGGIGIMNTMYTSILERTRQIGVMKAIGARDEQIMMIFLIESGIYGLVGGILGILVGIIVGESVEIFASRYFGSLFQINVTPAVILLVLAFSFLTGTLAGLAPARKAASLEPAEALRYE